MAQYLSNAMYDSTRPFRNEARFTLIEDTPQSNLPSYASRTKLTIPSLHRSSLLPNGGPNFTPASDQTSDVSSMWSHRSSGSSYDSLYDVSEDDVEEVPIKLSASVKRQARVSRDRSRYPSLVIPSPSAWPTIQKLQQTKSPCTVGLSPAMNISITPTALATFNARSTHSPAASTAPSLDGSLTSEELSSHSCPSTPDLETGSNPDDQVWDQPMQLDPHAFEILHQLEASSDNEHDINNDPVITISDDAVQEMQEIVKDTPLRPEFALLDTQHLAPDPDEIVSALSIPSPGGFFSSLAPFAAQTWGRMTPEPSTGVAEDFYGVPWRITSSSDNAAVSNLRRQNSLRRRPGQASTRVLIASPPEDTEVTELIDSSQSYQERSVYEEALRQIGLEHSDRTKLWLRAQESYLSRALQNTQGSDEGGESPIVLSSPTTGNATIFDTVSPSKKSVRFVDGLNAILAEAKKSSSEGGTNFINDPVFYHAFQHIAKVAAVRDAFRHRQARVEAVHTQRSHLTTNHCKQLQGDYQISTPIRPSPVRPISNMLPTQINDDSQKIIIATAERERQALDQVKPSMWAIDAEKRLSGDKLLSSPVDKLVKSLPEPKILDYGGQVAGGWGWQVALDYRNATVYTVPISQKSKGADKAAKGPSNHRILPSASPTSLPFPGGHFDVISARTLHTLLRAAMPIESPISPLSPQPAGEDEWDIALNEIHRILKPGGYLEFAATDASLLHPGPLGHALSVEFSFNLRTRGYDPTASTSLLPRLRKAGFDMIRRGWYVLPMADVRPRWTDAGKSNNGGDALGPNAPPPATTTSRKPVQRGSGTMNFFQVEKSIGPNGSVELYKPALTGSTADVQAMTGLVGSKAWEEWMLKLGAEMGKSEAQVMDQISRVLEEGSNQSGWKCLKGWARKNA
ncbi:hypothetical protein AAFC00_007316 [Neodothiora populina]|uniref:Methyltransferase type 11 domain-containing protein n=1 Tax=Neodothiora populina TaxID=2781224 RepID=A0ABR3PHX3_9PEZI